VTSQDLGNSQLICKKGSSTPNIFSILPDLFLQGGKIFLLGLSVSSGARPYEVGFLLSRKKEVYALSRLTAVRVLHIAGQLLLLTAQIVLFTQSKLKNMSTHKLGKYFLHDSDTFFSSVSSNRDKPLSISPKQWPNKKAPPQKVQSTPLWDGQTKKWVSDQEIQSLTTGKKLLEVCHICS
jgi:hypothetical protein